MKNYNLKFKNKIFITKNFEETQKLGEKFIRGFNPDKVRIIALYGELGAGKTTFVQGLAKGLGIKRRIISPTFIIVRQYKISPPKSPSPLRQGFAGRVGHLGGGEATTSTPARCNTFYHIDLYRIESEREVRGLGLDEILNNSGNIVAIEWAEKIGDLLQKERVDICFENLGEDERKITISKLT